MDDFDISKMHRSELEAEIVSMAKIIERFRNALGRIVIGIEDEGDRAYFGSNNDADSLREIESDMLDTLNGLEIPWMHGRDLYGDLRELQTALTSSQQAENAKLREALTFFRSVIKCGEPWTETCQKAYDSATITKGEVA